MSSLAVVKMIGITLLSIGLFIAAWRKKTTISIALLVIGNGFVLLMNSLE